MQDYVEILRRIGQKVAYKKDRVLFYEGDVPKRLYVLLEGIVRLYKTDSQGNQITIHSQSPQSFIAEMPLFEGIAYPATAVFQTDGVVLSVDFAKFCSTLEAQPKLSLAFIASLMSKIRILERHITQNVVFDLRMRFLGYCMEHSLNLDSLMQRKIAQDLNVTPQSLSRIIRGLKQEGLIDVIKGRIQIIDMNRLNTILCSN